jgi:hypothetical protein
MSDYVTAISDPALQARILGAEAQFRPEYLGLSQRDLQNAMMGVRPGQEGGFYGTLDLVGMSADRMADLNQRLATRNTEYTIDQLKSFGPAATQAYLAANPQAAAAMEAASALGGRQVSGYLNEMGRLAMQAGGGQTITAPQFNAPANVMAQQIMSGGTLTPERVAAERIAAERIAAGQVGAERVGAGALGESLYQQALNAQQQSPLSQALQARGLSMATTPGQLSPEEIRAATQGTREGFASSGRLMDNAAITGEALARAGAARERSMQDIAAAQQINQQLLGAQQQGQALATDVLRADIQRQQANVGTQLQAGQFNVDAALRASLANQQTGLAASQANQDAMLRAALANQQVGMQASQFNIQNLQDIQRLNQQANLQAGLANQQMGFNVAQLGSQQNLQAQLANRQFGLDELTARFNRLNQTTGVEQGMLNADRAYANQLANMYSGITPAAINLAGIGQNAAAIPLGMAGYEASSAAGRDIAPRFADPNAGVNIALGNQANQAGYGAAVAGGAASMAGARAGATASMAGSVASTLPYLFMRPGTTPTTTPTPKT